MNPAITFLCHFSGELEIAGAMEQPVVRVDKH
jgi:hypothetical protein